MSRTHTWILAALTAIVGAWLPHCLLAQTPSGPPSSTSGPPSSSSPDSSSGRGLVTQPTSSGAAPGSYGGLTNTPNSGATTTTSPAANGTAYSTVAAAQNNYITNQAVTANELASRSAAQVYGLTALNAPSSSPAQSAQTLQSVTSLTAQINETGNALDSALGLYLQIRDTYALAAAGYPIAAQQMAGSSTFTAESLVKAQDELNQAQQSYNAAWANYQAQTGLSHADVLNQLNAAYPPSTIDVYADSMISSGYPGITPMTTYPGNTAPAAQSAVIKSEATAIQQTMSTYPAAGSTGAVPGASPPPATAGAGARSVEIDTSSIPAQTEAVAAAAGAAAGATPVPLDGNSATAAGGSLVEDPGGLPMTVDQIDSVSANYQGIDAAWTALQSVDVNAAGLDSGSAQTGGSLQQIYQGYVVDQPGSSVIQGLTTQVAVPSAVITVPSNQVTVPSNQVTMPSSLVSMPSSQITTPSGLLTSPAQQPTLCGR